MSATTEQLHEVRLLQFPLEVNQRASEAFEGLRREFTLIALRTPDAQEVPRRLLQLVDALANRFQGFSDEAESVRDEAVARGETVLDELVYRVPTEAAEACVALSRMIDEADEYCRRGDFLLSLSSPPEAVAFRRWFLGEITAQLRGHPPLPWPEADHDALAANPDLRGGEPV